MIEVPDRTIRRLLDSSNPSVRWLTLREVLARRDNDPDVVAARRAIPDSAWTRRLTRGQHRDGWWVNPGNCYLPKYTATVWRLQALAELGMPGEDPRVRAACERFRWQNTMPDGGFTCGSPAHRGRYSEECVTGHMLFTLARFGLGEEPAARAAMRWLLGRQLPDGGWNCDHRPDVRHSSFVSTLAAMKALAAVPPRRRDAPRREAIARSVEFLLAHHVLWSDRTGKPVLRRRPFRVAFPAHYVYDVLQATRVLALLGVRGDSRIDDALAVLESKADSLGRWTVDRVPEAPNRDPRFRLRIEPEGRPGAWVTATALGVLRRFGRYRPPSSAEA